jgi:hypothetical protein
MKYDYKAALENFEGYAPYYDLYDSTEKAIIHALKLAEKVTGEPTEGMVKAACNHFRATADARFEEAYKVMTHQAKKEIEDEVR